MFEAVKDGETQRFLAKSSVKTSRDFLFFRLVLMS